MLTLEISGSSRVALHHLLVPGQQLTAVLSTDELLLDGSRKTRATETSGNGDRNLCVMGKTRRPVDRTVFWFGNTVVVVV